MEMCLAKLINKMIRMKIPNILTYALPFHHKSKAGGLNSLQSTKFQSSPQSQTVPLNLDPSSYKRKIRDCEASSLHI